MGLCGSITALAGITRRCSGLWRLLTVRAQGRVALELERERNRATAEVIQVLPDNCELLEYEPMGRLRIIRKLGSAVPAPTMAEPIAAEPAVAAPTVVREVLPGQSR
jgi:hypothetical protein